MDSWVVSALNSPVLIPPSLLPYLKIRREWDPVKGHMTNETTPANGIWDVDDGAAKEVMLTRLLEGVVDFENAVFYNHKLSSGEGEIRNSISYFWWVAY